MVDGYPATADRLCVREPRGFEPGLTKKIARTVRESGPERGRNRIDQRFLRCQSLLRRFPEFCREASDDE